MEDNLIARTSTYSALLKGLLMRFLFPYLPQQIGIFERKNHTLQVFAEVMLYAIKLNIEVPYHIYGIFLIKKICYYAPNIVLPNIPYFDESNLVVGGKFLDVLFMYRPIRSLHLKVLRSESNALNEKL